MAQDKQRISVKLNGKEHSFSEIEKEDKSNIAKETDPTKDTKKLKVSPLFKEEMKTYSNEKVEKNEHQDHSEQPRTITQETNKTSPLLPFKDWSSLKEFNSYESGHKREHTDPPEFEVSNESEADEQPKQQSKNWFGHNIIDFKKMKEDKEEQNQPYWDDGNRGWSPKLPSVKRKKKTSDRFKNTLAQLPLSLIVAGVSAIIVGVGFGFMVLTAFTGEAEAERSTASLTPANEVVETVATNSPAETVSLPDLSVEIVQGGAFSTSDKGNEIVSAIKSRGQAAVLKTDSDPMYMFIGLGLQKEEAGRLSQLYQAQGQETYVKPFAVNGSLASIDNESGNQFFAHAGTMFNELVRFSVAGLAGQSVSVENIDIFMSQFQQWRSDSELVLASLPEEAKRPAEQFITSMVSAAAQLEDYKQGQEENKLWGIQQHLLETLLAYDTLIEILK